MAEAPEETQAAAHAAMQAGHAIGTSEFHGAMRDRFNALMAENERRASAASTPAVQSTPEYFKPASEPPRERDQSSLVSAPVSRQVPTSGRTYEMAPSEVRLTADERAIARASGISETEYAKGKLKMLREQAEGTRQR